MIALIGRGYIGSAFKEFFHHWNIEYIRNSHDNLDSFWKVHEWLKESRPELVINAAAFIPVKSVAECDWYSAETLTGNTLFPAALVHACEDQGIPFAHISTGCLWNDGKEHSEQDEPQRAFSGYCGFYVGSKVLAEQVVRKYPKHYIWRVRLPFDDIDCGRNYLRKLIDFEEVFDHDNSLSHRGDFVRACVDLWRIRAPYGTYNVMNPGSVKATTIIERLLKMGLRTTRPTIISGKGGDAKVSVEKLLKAGVAMRPIEAALDDALSNWKKA